MKLFIPMPPFKLAASNFQLRVLEEAFHWAYRLVSTRLFAQEEDVLVPLADHLNHANVNVSMVTCEEAAFADPSSEAEVDYQDFVGTKRTTEPKEFPKRTFKSRFEKYMKANPKANLKVGNVWDLNAILKEYKSSEDEEDYSEAEEPDSEEEEEEESKEEAEKAPQPTAYFYVLKTGPKGSCKAGKQLSNCYGNYSNRQLLLYYGFALDGNPYDSLLIRLWNPAFGGRIGLMTIEDIAEKRYNEELAAAKLEDVSQLFRLKKNKINFALLTYFRQEVLKELSKEPTTTKAVASLMQASPTTELVEIPVLERTIGLLTQVSSLKFTSRLEADTAIDPDGIPIRLQFALRYRIAQKRILTSQLGLLTRLSAILQRMKDGADITEAHMSQGTVEELYPLMAYLRALQVNNSRWTQLNPSSS